MNLAYLSRSFPRLAILSALIFAAVTNTSPASAAPVEYAGMCQRSVSVGQWTPQKGPIARFVADTFIRSEQTGVWIGLGRVGTSFWSAEGGDASDACDDCRSFYLFETRADGTRKQHTLLDSQDHARMGSDLTAQKTHILARLWQLADHTWPVDKLTQNYTLTLGQPDANDASSEQSFAVHVAAKDIFDIHYDFTASTSMCWCMYQWSGRNGR